MTLYERVKSVVRVVSIAVGALMMAAYFLLFAVIILL
jgi:hypothetical protein